MSYTTIYELPSNAPLIELAEFPNVWGSAMRIWQALIERYLITRGCQGLERDVLMGRILMGGGRRHGITVEAS